MSTLIRQVLPNVVAACRVGRGRTIHGPQGHLYRSSEAEPNGTVSFRMFSCPIGESVLEHNGTAGDRTHLHRRTRPVTTCGRSRNTRFLTLRRRNPWQAFRREC
ncbi:hypothetical protein GCM10010517_53670 [Streptosporangium fragile]|uniref:Uncharacterized protein n=1 Tax=Streptosporangium fragile TaxID=46186 RepID=A0ABP6IJA4_9ACTN